MALTLVLGPRRSGKSAVAERLASASGHDVTYIAPLTVTDPELERRVAVHRARRPSTWTTVETVAVVDALHRAPDDAVVLLDSLGTWIAEVLWRAGPLDLPLEDPVADGLIEDVRRVATLAASGERDVVIVAEEAGWGPVPPAPGTRRWLDLLGDAAQELSHAAERVVLVVAGRTVELR